jgi:FG-GAP repeat
VAVAAGGASRWLTWLVGLVGACLAMVLMGAVVGGVSLGGSPGRARPADRASDTWAKVPLAAREVISRDLGADERQFAVTRAGANLVAKGLGISATFGRDGGVVHGGSGVSLQLGLKAIGRGHSLVTIAPSGPVGRSNIVRYERSGIDEWYANGPLGFEQGFTLRRRVSGDGQLSLVVGTVPAADHVTVSSDGAAIVITGAHHGSRALHYGGLSVTDARGDRMPASLTMSGRRIMLRINDSRGRYPLRIDPTVALFDRGANLTESDDQTGISFGSAVAMSQDGRTVVVGAPSDVPYNATWSGSGGGAVFVFTESPSAGWQSSTETAELVASDGQYSDVFGASVAISGDGSTVVVGSLEHGSDAGAAYVFSEPASGGWRNATETAELTASDGASTTGSGQRGDELGYSVAVSRDGSTVVAGAPNHSTYAGAAYVFTEPVSGGWQDETQTAELSSTDAVTSNQLGSGSQVGGSVAISDDGETIVADAAQREVSGTPAPGAVDVFVEPSSGGWQSATQTAELTSSDNTTPGFQVVISGDGSTIASANTSNISVFGRPASGGWQDATQTAKLTSDDAPMTGGLGISRDGGMIVVGVQIGEPEYDGGRNPGAGAAYEFSEPANGGWTSETETAEFSTAAGPNGRYVFYSETVAISGDGGTVVVGSTENGNGPVMVYPPLPANSLPPAVAGDPVQGQTLIETNGTWSSNPTSYSYQWEDCDSTGQNCSPINGAHGQSYTPTDADIGSTIVVQETATNVAGPGALASSNPTPVIQALSPTSVPAISGKTTQGQTLTDDNASWNGPVSGYAYQWERCRGSDCSDIDGATDQSYTLTNADAGWTIEVEEDAFNAGGFGIPTSSDPTAVVIPLVPMSTQVPVISGSAVEGNALVAATLPWTNTPTTISYQWEDCDSAGQNCKAITGATSKTYTLAASDIGRRIVVAEAASNAGGTSAPATSAATGAVPESGPVGLEIDDGDYATDNPNVTIEAAWPPGTESILVSNNGGFRTSTQTFAPAATIAWTLERTGTDRLPKTVYVRFLGVGQDDVNFTDDIILDETAPTIQTATLGGAGAGAAQVTAARAPKIKTYRLRLRAKDQLVGVCEAATNQNRSSKGEELMPLTSCRARGIPKVSRTLKLKLRSRPRYVRVQNSAGKWSRWTAVTN